MFKLFLLSAFCRAINGYSRHLAGDTPAGKEIIHVTGIWRKHCYEYWVRQRKYKACRSRQA
ncbi:hypothetical protein FE241_04210 [Raoultella terrigena]|nr:hypothetical protein [Raoultella terrigena]